MILYPKLDLAFSSQSVKFPTPSRFHLIPERVGSQGGRAVESRHDDLFGPVRPGGTIRAAGPTDCACAAQWDDKGGGAH